MTVSAKVRKSLPASRLGKPGTGGFPMPDKKHAAIAKGFAAMHDDPDKAAIDAKADKILAKKRGGFISGAGKRPHLGRKGKQLGGGIDPAAAVRASPALRPGPASAPPGINRRLPPGTPAPPGRNMPRPRVPGSFGTAGYAAEGGPINEGKG